MRIKRYLQDPAHCATAASAAIANYYNPNIDYDVTKKIANYFVAETKNGLDDGEIGKLLNILGFKKIDVVSSNLFMFDYSWARLSKKKLLEAMDDSRNKISEVYRDQFKILIKFLKSKSYKNNLIIDYNYHKHIKKALKLNLPVIAGYNWTQLFKLPKENSWGVESPARGDWVEHAVVIYKCDKKGVFICDSHHESYKYKLKRYKSGRYKLSWETLMVILSYGSIIIPKEYDEDIYNETITEMGE